MSVGAVNKQTGDRIPTAGMPAIDDALDLTSTNPVQNAIITAALANKQDKTDNNLETTSKTVVGAVNELRSGLTNYEATTNAALSVPEDSGKNLFSGSFTTTTNGGVTFTANSDGTVSATNTSTGYASVNSTEFTLKKGQYIFSGAPSGNTKYVLELYANNVVLSQIANGGSVTINLDSDTALVMRCVINGADVETGVDFEPMIRPSYVTDATFAPYIPSVETQLETLNSKLTGVFTADLLYEGAPTQADTYEEKNLISGKSITDYLLILFVCRQYNNTVAFAIEPKHVFTQQTGDSSRVIFKYGDGTLQTVMVYYVSPTKIAVNQKTVDGTVWKTALYGIIKQP